MPKEPYAQELAKSYAAKVLQRPELHLAAICQMAIIVLGTSHHHYTYKHAEACLLEEYHQEGEDSDEYEPPRLRDIPDPEDGNVTNEDLAMEHPDDDVDDNPMYPSLANPFHMIPLNPRKVYAKSMLFPG